MRVLPAPITAARLAEETGVSLRSLYRDIDSLRAAGACIEGERGYGYRLIEDYTLPPQTFNRAELEAIALGLTEVKSMGDSTLAAAATTVLAKIAAILPHDREQQLFHAISHVYRPEAPYKVTADVDSLRQACWHERALQIRYVDTRDAVTDRVILPLAIAYTADAMTVLAWCTLREGYRMFRVERILQMDGTGQSFRPRRAALLREYLAELKAREAPSLPAETPTARIWAIS